MRRSTLLTPRSPTGSQVLDSQLSVMAAHRVIGAAPPEVAAKSMELQSLNVRPSPSAAAATSYATPHRPRPRDAHR